MAPLRITFIAALAVLCGCRTGGGPPPERKPLFGGDAEPTLGTAAPKGPPARTSTPTQTERLLVELRGAEGTRRQELVRELLSRGAAARPDVERARGEQQVLLDVLDEVLAQLEEKEPEPETEAAPGKLPGRVPVSPWVRDKYRLALDRYLAGNIYGCLQAIEAILALEPDTALRPKLRRLRLGCQERLLRESVLLAEVSSDRDVLLPGQPIHAVVTLKNLSRERVTLRLAKLRLGTLTLDYEELSPDGAHTRTRVSRPIRAQQDEIVLGAGQRSRIVVALPTPHDQLPAGLVGRYHLSGRLRPQTMLVGETAYPMFLPLGSRSVIVLRPKDWGLSQDTEARFAEAVLAAQTGTLEQRADPARQAFVAAVLLAEQDRELALERLAKALENATGALSDALCSALARATGEPLSFTRQEWLIWWKGRQSRPSKSTSSRE